MINKTIFLFLLAAVSSCRKDIEVSYQDGGGYYLNEDGAKVEFIPDLRKVSDLNLFGLDLVPNSRFEPFLNTIQFSGFNVCEGDTIFFSNSAETDELDTQVSMNTIYASDYILTPKFPYNNGVRQNWLYFEYVGRKQKEVKGSFSLVLKRDGEEIRPWIPSTEFSVCRDGQFRAFLIPN